jgi:hypothetical protein
MDGQGSLWEVCSCEGFEAEYLRAVWAGRERKPLMSLLQRYAASDDQRKL